MGRPVFVVPGDVDRPSSEGCNRLIKDGAHPVLGPADLIAELELVLGPAMRHGDDADELPATGIDLEDLSEAWGIDIAATLARVGTMELEGRARLRGRRVFPG
jgi:DNA processing protein